MPTTKRAAISHKFSHTTKILDNYTDKTNIQPTSDVSPVANVGEENISPRTISELEPCQTGVGKFEKPIKGHGGIENDTKIKKKPAKGQPKRAAKARLTARGLKKSSSIIPAPGEPNMHDTIAGRLFLRKRYGTSRDGVASEGTIRPLTDLSEVSGVAGVPIVSDNVTSTFAKTPTQEQGTLELKGQPVTTEVEERPLTSARITSALHSTLHLSAASTGESRRFPNIPQRPSRGVKRVLDSSENTDESEQIDGETCSSRFSRPTKRKRKNPESSEPPEVTSTPNDEGTSNLHVSESIPISSSRVSPPAEDTYIEIPVPMPDFDLPYSISEVLTSALTSILNPIPPTSLHDISHTSGNQEATEKEGEVTQYQTPLRLDTTQGSSWLSSVFELRDFNFEETPCTPSRSRIEAGRSD